MRLTRLFPPPAAAPGEAESAREQSPEAQLVATMTELYRPLPGRPVRINLVASADGCVVGEGGTSDDLSSRVDRLLLGVIRSFADVILVGAGTVRTEGYRMPRSARLAVVTSSGELGGHRVSARPGDLPLIVLCPASVVGRVRRTSPELDVEIVTLPDRANRISMTDVISALHDRALVNIVCEGGPTLATQLVAAGCAHELCLTTSPVLAGVGPRLFETLGTRHPLALTQMLSDDDGFLFSRWSITGSGSAESPPTL